MLLIIDTFFVLKLKAEKTHCPVLVYVTSSDNVCLMELKVLCKCVLCLKNVKEVLCFESAFQPALQIIFGNILERGGPP